MQPCPTFNMPASVRSAQHAQQHAADAAPLHALLPPQGFCANPLELGCDCLGHIKYWDAVLNNSRGEARLPADAAAAAAVTAAVTAAASAESMSANGQSYCAFGVVFYSVTRWPAWYSTILFSDTQTVRTSAGIAASASGRAAGGCCWWGAGGVQVIKKAVCMKEEDAGMAWKHLEYRNMTAEVRAPACLCASILVHLTSWLQEGGLTVCWAGCCRDDGARLGCWP